MYESLGCQTQQVEYTTQTFSHQTVLILVSYLLYEHVVEPSPVANVHQPVMEYAQAFMPP